MEKILGRLYPYFYLIKTFHHSLIELIVQFGSKKSHQKDWDDLVDHYPALVGYEIDVPNVQAKLSPLHKQYITKVSVDFVSTSMEASCFLDYFTYSIEPQNILDLGSGFSTLIFQKYAWEKEAIKVYSVDESEFWLEKTRQYLSSEGFDAQNLMTEDEFQTRGNLKFDLIYIDIGDYTHRLSYLNGIFDKKMLIDKGVVILDDFHIYPYRKAVKHLCAQKGYQVFSLRIYTRSRLKFLALIKK